MKTNTNIRKPPIWPRYTFISAALILGVVALRCNSRMLNVPLIGMAAADHTTIKVGDVQYRIIALSGKLWLVYTFDSNNLGVEGTPCRWLKYPLPRSGSHAGCIVELTTQSIANITDKKVEAAGLTLIAAGAITAAPDPFQDVVLREVIGTDPTSISLDAAGATTPPMTVTSVDRSGSEIVIGAKIDTFMFELNVDRINMPKNIADRANALLRANGKIPVPVSYSDLPAALATRADDLGVALELRFEGGITLIPEAKKFQLLQDGVAMLRVGRTLWRAGNAWWPIGRWTAVSANPTGKSNMSCASQLVPSEAAGLVVARCVKDYKAVDPARSEYFKDPFTRKIPDHPQPAADHTEPFLEISCPLPTQSRAFLCARGACEILANDGGSTDGVTDIVPCSDFPSEVSWVLNQKQIGVSFQ